MSASSIGGVEYDPLEDEEEYRDGYYVACVRAPTRQTLQKFSKPPCHLLMMSPTHVAYIPDIEDYLNKVFHATRRGEHGRRCKYCFAVFGDRREDLQLHYLRGECYLNTPMPTKVSCSSRDIINEKSAKNLLPRDLTVVIDIECTLQNPVSEPTVSAGGQVDYTPLFHGADGAQVHQNGVTHMHVPVSVGIAFLDHRYEVIDYVVQVSDNLEAEFPTIMKTHVDRISEDLRGFTDPGLVIFEGILAQNLK